MKAPHPLSTLVILTTAVGLIAPVLAGPVFSEGTGIERDPGIVAGPMIVQIPADRLTLIHAPSGAGFRVLLTFPGLAELAGTTVYSARLEIPGIRFDEPMALEVFPLTTAWSAGSVSWDAPWRQPGGDYQVIRGAYTRRGDESDQPARFNVSSAIRAVVNDGASDAGFILMPSRHAAEGTSPSGLPEAFATEVGALTGIKLVVFCASS